MESKASEKEESSYYRQAFIKGNISVNDLRDRLDYGQEVSSEELRAIKNFEHYQISVLNQQLSDEDFHKKYKQIQVLANLGSYKEFLKDKYSF